MHSYIYDFLRVFFDKLPDRERIRGIYLFGSLARGNPHQNSDVDLFIDVESSLSQEIEELARESVNEFEIYSEKTWKLRGVTYPFSIIVGDLQDQKWNELQNEIVQYGFVLYRKLENKALKNKHPSERILLSYDLSSQKQAHKMTILRNLFGYSLKKGNKVYRSEGLLPLGFKGRLSNALILDKNQAEKVIEILKKYRVSYKKL